MITFMSTTTRPVSAQQVERYLVHDALSLAPAAISYRVGDLLATQFPQHAIIVSDDSDFDIEQYAKAGHCELRMSDSMHAEIVASWDRENEEIIQTLKQGWMQIEWQGTRFDVLRMTWPSDCRDVQYRWAITEHVEQAQAFFRAVCAFNSAVGETIMVFQDGYWAKSTDLYRSIKRATLENLILEGTLKQDLYADLLAFFQAKAIYTQANLPWKRGIVLIGPPGNGKTHAIKALINALGKSCLYVKSFSAEHVDDHRNIRAVFEEARGKAPCVLVLEDLDSLVTEHNRSFFLNELDGFASNEGIVTIASTNYPEKLDPAIMARPSRFDRKYHFGLPCEQERHTYLQVWSQPLDAAMRPSAALIAQLASGTEGFSFAYLKELLVSSTIRWVEKPTPGAMEQIMPAQLIELRTQMASNS